MAERLRTLLHAAVRRPLLAALLISAAFAFAGIFQHDLWAPDEPRDAQMGKEMLERGFPALPTLGGEPFLEKPPLFFWAVGAAFRLFGVGDGVARIPSALATVATGLIVCAMARRAAGRSAGVLAALVLATCSEFWSVSHKALNDIFLTAFVAGGHLAFLTAWDRFRAGRPTLPAFAAAGLCCGLGFLTKGVVAPALLAGPVVVALAALREWRFLGHVVFGGGALCVGGIVAVAGPWALALWDSPDGRGPEYLRTCLWEQTVARGVGGSESVGAHARGPLAYLPMLPSVLFPWTLAAPAVWLGGTLRGARFRRVAFLALTVGAAVLLLSLAAGKRELYLTPLLPAAAAVLAAWLSRCSAARRADRFTAATLLGALGAVATLGAAAAVAATAGYLHVRESVGEFITAHGTARVLALAAVGAAGGVALLLAARRALDPSRPALGLRVACGVGAVLLAVHAAARPLLDPVKSLRRGALAVAAAVPADEPMIGLDPDELLVSVVGFYADRTLHAPPRREVLPLLRAGRTRHVVILDKREADVPPALREVLHEVARIELSPRRDVSIRVYDPGLDSRR